MEYKFISKSNDETIQFASKFVKFLSKQDVLVMDGDLGAGKTCFAKGIGKGLNIKDTIISPTFNIVRCYFDGDIPFYHIDAYRLEGNSFPIGLEEYLEGDGICLVEWASYIPTMIPSSHLKINIKIIDENTREYTFISHDEHYDKVLERIKNEL